MRWSKTFIPTLKEDPADAEVVSHKLLVRAGFIRQLSRGIYDYLPLSLKVVRKIETIVREEMDRAGAQELRRESGAEVGAECETRQRERTSHETPREPDEGRDENEDDDCPVGGGHRKEGTCRPGLTLKARLQLRGSGA